MDRTLNGDQPGDVEELVDALKKLRQREGILSMPRPDFPLHLFGARSWSDLRSVVKDCFDFMSPSNNSGALYAALGFRELEENPSLLDRDGEHVQRSTVIERRIKFAREAGMSFRTAERREQSEAEELARIILVTAQKPDLYGFINDCRSSLHRLAWACVRSKILLNSNRITAMNGTLDAIEREVAFWDDVNSHEELRQRP